MADTEQKTEQEGKPKKKFSIKAMILISIGIFSVVILLGTSGYGMGKLLTTVLAPKSTPSVEGLSALPEETPQDKPNNDTEDSWYYDLEPVVANLDEPGATRYVRATVTLEISNSFEQGKGTKLIEEKKPHLRNWLVIYLAGLTLDDARGEKNLKRIQSHILDAYNETLFPGSQPHIKRILFKEGFAIQ